ncbi:MAG: VOC family protein [Myxococcaceae bacterium]|nr:VOC family protein [Myxococcaceae bacterium]
MRQLFVCIDVPDLDRAIAFYTRAFGLTVSRRLGDSFAELTGASCPLHLLNKAAGTKPSPKIDAERDYRRHWTPVHLDLVVDDLDSAVQRAIAAGATLDREPVTARWGRMANLADPFGHGFCLLQFLGRGYDELLDPQA